MREGDVQQSKIMDEVNKQYDLALSNNSKCGFRFLQYLPCVVADFSTQICANKRRIQQAISVLERKKKQIDHMKEVYLYNFMMTKERYDTVHDNLMIRKLQLNVEPMFENAYGQG